MEDDDLLLDDEEKAATKLKDFFQLLQYLKMKGN